MKMKAFAVITLLVLACSFAVAGSWTFGFGSVGGGLYCNYEQINNNTGGVAGLDSAAYQGFDNFSACGLSSNSHMIGFGPYTLPKGVTFSGFGVHVTKGAVLDDDILDLEGYTGEQWVIATSLTCSSKSPKINKDWWIGLLGLSGFVFGDNAGPLSCSIPANGKHNGLLTTGQAAK